MINRQQKVLSSSFVIILLLAGRIMFIIHMISDALELKRKALFLSQREALEREKEGAQGTMEIVKWRSEVFSFLPSSSTRSFSVTLYVVLRGSLLIELHLQCDLNIWLFILLLFFCQLLMCGTGNISVSDFRQNHSVINSGMSFGKVVNRLH